MIGIVMAGGKGTRMVFPNEKLLLQYKKPVILHVMDALRKSNCFSKIIAVTSKNSPKTKKLLEQNDIQIINAPGTGYVEDLNYVLKSFNEDVLVTSGDLPLLDSQIIKKIISLLKPENIWTSFVVTKKFLESQNLSGEYPITVEDIPCQYSGISLVNSKKITKLDFVKEMFVILNDKRIAFNLNTKRDYDLLCTT